ncbi:MAG: JmjC domain-containing protein [Bacteroidota bacterium]
MHSIFGQLSIEEFLHEYWQKKPLLVRQALPDYRSPVSKEELFEMACDESAEARLILEKGGDYPWEVRIGPFERQDFQGLPATHWTLLVQEVDRLNQEVGALLDHFRFVPDWRIDDVMVSYAADQGSVGAHVDNYDVFLIQAMGRRRWQISSEAVKEERLVPDVDVRLLADFEADEDWVLEPGDMLYLPPRLAHYGIARGECMTFSVGFRAPSDAELITNYLSVLAEDVDPTLRYRDPEQVPATQAPGEIDVRTLEHVRRAIRRAIENEEHIDRWFGRYITEPQRGFFPPIAEEELTPDDVRQAIDSGAVIQRHPAVRMAYFRRPHGTTGLFVAGEEYEFDESLANFAALLANRRSFRASELTGIDDPTVYEVLADLINEGFLRISMD